MNQVSSFIKDEVRSRAFDTCCAACVGSGAGGVMLVNGWGWFAVIGFLLTMIATVLILRANNKTSRLEQEQDDYRRQVERENRRLIRRRKWNHLATK